MRKFFYPILIFLLVGCNNESDKNSTFERAERIDDGTPTLFEIMGNDRTGLDFQNKIKETVEVNYLNFMHLYMGGGVATADFNNDGLQDVYFVSNRYQDKLYLNKGDLNFEDITKKSGITKLDNNFSTGVTVVDINNDGFMDIYLCRSGWFQTGNVRLTNQLYINNGDLTFTEKAKEYGLDDTSHSTQALFFDYDLDGDLDLYLVNTPVEFLYTTVVAPMDVLAKDPKLAQLGSSDKLYENSNGIYLDVSARAGLLQEIAFGLNAVICDINNDGYPDIHVSNDFVGPDFLYENQKNGTFREVATNRLKHTSFYSMGSDIADINNDGNLDLMVLDMSFADYKESKTSMSMGNRDGFKRMIESKHNYQYMHNMLHLGDGDGGFSEISQLSGLDKTDWSWSPLFIDFDHDGFKDVYVTNGILRNVLDMDGQARQRRELAAFQNSGQRITQEKIDYFMNFLPESKMTNYIFKNVNGLKFEKKNNVWLSEKPGITQGAAYADFDNDGDLDIVMNNTNEPATILKNLASEKLDANSIIIELKNPQSKNQNGIGAIVQLEIKGTIQKQIITPNRGYFSASQNIAHFGVGNEKIIEKIQVTWPDGKIQTIEDVEPNQLLVVDYQPNSEKQNTNEITPLFIEVNPKPSIVHTDPYSDDYLTQVLIPHRLSSYGPKLITGDLDNDGLTDVYIPGGNQQNGSFYYNSKNEFTKSELNQYQSADKEETCGAIADFNNDGFNDIYIGCGSYQFNKTAEVTDYLLFGNSKGIFSDASSRIPKINTNTSKVLPFDYDQDGDLDIFIGSRVESGAYPVAPQNYILKNNNGSFVDVTKSVAPELQFFGMVTDADWKLENDKIQLVVVGEWTGIGLFEFDGSTFKLKSNNISTKYGWWNSVKFADLDNDGDQDIVAGNLGLNYKFHASEEKPFMMYYGDLDNNNTQEIVLAKESSGMLVPIRGKECSTEQMPIVSEKFPTFNEFANQDLFGIYGEELKNANHHKATMFETAVFICNGENFETRILPIQAQFSTVNGIIVKDINKDGFPDLILAGNMYESEIETTKADAGKGVVLINDGKANFKPMPYRESGFLADRNAKSIALVEGEQKDFVFVGNNNDAVQIFSLNK